MTLKRERELFFIVTKILGTGMLLGIIVIWSIFLIVFLPMILITINHGRTQKTNPFNLSIMMFPAGVCALLIWRIWYPRWNPNILDSDKFDKLYQRIPKPLMRRVGR